MLVKQEDKIFSNLAVMFNYERSLLRSTDPIVVLNEDIDYPLIKIIDDVSLKEEKNSLVFKTKLFSYNNLKTLDFNNRSVENYYFIYNKPSYKEFFNFLLRTNKIPESYIQKNHKTNFDLFVYENILYIKFPEDTKLKRIGYLSIDKNLIEKDYKFFKEICLSYNWNSYFQTVGNEFFTFILDTRIIDIKNTVFKSLVKNLIEFFQERNIPIIPVKNVDKLQLFKTEEVIEEITNTMYESLENLEIQKKEFLEDFLNDSLLAIETDILFIP